MRILQKNIIKIKTRRSQMKKIIVLFSIVLAAFYTLTLFTACNTPPPPPPSTSTQTPPPPPPDPGGPPPDISPPEVSVELTPQPYSPINPDGEEQFLTANIHVKSASPIYGWQVEIREPESDEVFVSLAQEGEVPETITWDGRDLKGELVESGAVYNYTLTVTNIYHGSMVDQDGYIIPEDKKNTVAGQKVNGSTTYQGTIAIDVLVQREEKGLLRIIVPSIIFAPDTGELTKKLDPVTAANNDRILRRIADVLNYFGTYKVRVEGHANPTYPPNSRYRASEETGTRRILGLQPLSEQRAKAVVEYLVKLGIDRSRLSPVGMGGTRTRVEFNDRANWWKNRRVEFILEKP
jgi:outer membrane protein OmpA-like peptidoglycan-associated protein